MKLPRNVLGTIRGLSQAKRPSRTGAPAVSGLLMPNSAQHFGGRFDYVDYIHCNRDLADKFLNASAAAEHYQNHGIAEGRALASGLLDERFVRKLYGIKLDPGATIQSAGRLVQTATGIARFYPTRAHALLFNGIINDDFLKFFDHDYYLAINDLTSVLGKNPTRSQCITHFCEVGINLAFPFSFSRPFDAGYYESSFMRETGMENPVGEPRWLLTPDAPTVYPRDALQGRSAAQAHKAKVLRHWLNVGLPSGAGPNLKDWIESKFNVDVGSVQALNLSAYRTQNKDVAALVSDKEVAAHFIETGLVENRPGTTPTIHTAALFVSRADYLSGIGLLNEAGWIFDRVMYAVPDFPPSFHPAADNFLKQRFYGSAITLYRAAIGKRAAKIWTYFNLAQALTALQDHRGAYRALADAGAAFREDFQFQLRLENETRTYFDLMERAARSSAEAGQINQAQAELTALCDEITPPVETTANRRNIRRIALVANRDLYQCRVYRVDQKAEQLVAAGFEVSVFDHQDGVTEFIDAVDGFEAVIFYRVASRPDIITAITTARARGLVTFYDIDDLIFDPAHYPEDFGSYGGLISRSEYAGLALGVPLFAHAMSLCDYGMASTPTLAKQMQGVVRTGEVFVHRNGFGHLHERAIASALERPTTDVVTIFYGSGTKAHKEDFRELVEPALRKLVKRHGARVRICIVGYNPLSDAAADIADNVTVLPPVWNLELFWNLLQNADINVAVVKPSVVTAAKSEIKWMEAAMFGIPSVVSRTATYEEVVQDGIDGFLCDSSDDFYKHLNALVSDRALRRNVGKAARMAALDGYSVAKLAGNLNAIMAALSPPAVSRRKIVIVNVFYPPQAFGGATRVVHDNVRDLQAAYGHLYDFEVFTTIEGGLKPFEVVRYVQDGVRVTGVVTPDNPEINRIYESLRMASVFRAFLAEAKPDLIHFHCLQRLTVSVVTVAAERNIPYLITAHDGWWISERQFLVDEDGEIETYDYRDPLRIASGQGGTAAARATTLKPALFGAAAILAVSDQFAEIYRGAGVPNVRSVPNGVSKLPAATRSRSPDHRVRLGHVGGTERHKGLYLVKNALLTQPFRNLRLTVVDYAAESGSVVEETWGTTPVRIIARLPQEAVGELYSEIDVHLAVSVWPESYGLVTRESASVGCWVVASDAGSVAEPVQDNVNGHIVKAGDLDDLVRVLRLIDDNPNRYLGPTDAPPLLRRSAEQAADLASIFDEVLGRLDRPGRSSE